MANMQSIPTVDRTRLQADFDALADLTEPGRPWTRRSFTLFFWKGAPISKPALRKKG